MFNFDNLKSLHIELSTRCQAKCAMCGRNNHGGLPNPNLKLSDMSLSLFKTIVNQEVLSTVSKYCFCGNFGDPMMNDDLINICSYITKNNPSAKIHIHTNGAARKPDWWVELRKSLPDDHCIFFAIDGLEDTHKIYRTGADFNKVIDNSQAFIDVGGIAEWVFIKFKHNQHQVKQAHELSRLMGFARFTMKNTIRFVGDDKFSVVDKNGSHLYYLEPPVDNKMQVVNIDAIEIFKKEYSKIEIDCYAKKNDELYIDAHGKVYPCCFIAQGPYSNPNDRPMISDIKSSIVSQYYEVESKLGGEDSIDLSKRSLRNIVEDPLWQNLWPEYWEDGKLMICAKTCGKHDGAKPKDQIISNILN